MSTVDHDIWPCKLISALSLSWLPSRQISASLRENSLQACPTAEDIQFVTENDGEIDCLENSKLTFFPSIFLYKVDIIWNGAEINVDTSPSWLSDRIPELQFNSTPSCSGHFSCKKSFPSCQLNLYAHIVHTYAHTCMHTHTHTHTVCFELWT